MKRKLSKNQNNKVKVWQEIAGHTLTLLSNGRVFVNTGAESSVLSSCDCIRAISETVPESAIRNLLLKCLVDAENAGAGGSFVALGRLSGQVKNDDEFGKRFTLDAIGKSLASLTDKFTSEVVMSSLTIAGRQGKIMLDSTGVQHTEILYGTQACKWKPDLSFFSAVKSAKVSVQNCKVVFIDGIIESVSECHKIFQDSYEKKIPVVIFARGFNEEVVATAAINIQRQTASVIPIVIPFDEVGVNAMGDLANCFQSEVISSDKGQLISNIRIDGCSSAERITCTTLSTEIEFANNFVDKVVSKLSSRLKDCSDAQASLIRGRINALGSGVVTIKVGSDKRAIVGIQRDRIDFGLRYVKSCLASGAIEYQGILIPYSSFKSGIKSADSFSSLLAGCGAILEVDRCG